MPLLVPLVFCTYCPVLLLIISSVRSGEIFIVFICDTATNLPKIESQLHSKLSTFQMILHFLKILFHPQEKMLPKEKWFQTWCNCLYCIARSVSYRSSKFTFTLQINWGKCKCSSNIAKRVLGNSKQHSLSLQWHKTLVSLWQSCLEAPIYFWSITYFSY